MSSGSLAGIAEDHGRARGQSDGGRPPEGKSADDGARVEGDGSLAGDADDHGRALSQSDGVRLHEEKSADAGPRGQSDGGRPLEDKAEDADARGESDGLPHDSCTRPAVGLATSGGDDGAVSSLTFASRGDDGDGRDASIESRLFGRAVFSGSSVGTAASRGDDGLVSSLAVASRGDDTSRGDDGGGGDASIESRLFGIERRLDGLQELPKALACLQDMPKQVAHLHNMPQQLNAIIEALTQLQVRLPVVTGTVSTPSAGNGTLGLESVCEQQQHQHLGRRSLEQHQQQLQSPARRRISTFGQPASDSGSVHFASEPGSVPAIGQPAGNTGMPTGDSNSRLSLELLLQRKRRQSVCSQASSVVSGVSHAASRRVSNVSHSQALSFSTVRGSRRASNATAPMRVLSPPESTCEDSSSPVLQPIRDGSILSERPERQTSVSPVAEEPTDLMMACASLPARMPSKDDLRMPSKDGFRGISESGRATPERCLKRATTPTSKGGDYSPSGRSTPERSPRGSGTVPDVPLVASASFIASIAMGRKSICRQMTGVSLGGRGEQAGAISSLELGSTEKIVLPRCIFLPTAPARLAWDLFLAAAITLVCLLVPTGLVYTGPLTLRLGPLARLMLALDVIWALDIAINFRTAVVLEDGRIDAPRGIALRYLRRWLVWDVLTAFPVTLVPGWPGSMASFLLGLKLLRASRLPGLFARVQKELRTTFLQPVKVMLLLALLSHAVSCSWRLALRSDGGTSVGGSDEFDGIPWLELYVQDVYWVLMTLTTVGYGDIVPRGFRGRLFAILAMLVAPLFTGVVVSALTHVTKGFFEDQIENRVAEVTRFMERRRLPVPIQRRVQHNLRQHLRTENQKSMDPELFALLSPSMQRELSLALLSSTVLQFPLFRGTQRAFVAELAQAHTWVRCLPDDLVVEAGQVVEEMVFVIAGRLRLLSAEEEEEEEEEETLDGDTDDEASNSDAQEEAEVVVQTGAWFGEACLFEEGRVRTETIIAVLESELAVLPAMDYHRIIRKYPRLLEKHRSIDSALKSDVCSMEELAYKPPKPVLRRMSWHASSWTQFIQMSAPGQSSGVASVNSGGFSDLRGA